MSLIGDRERERVASLLKSHYLRGRLSIEELTERLGVTFSARRDTELRLALAELPGAWHEQSGRAWTGLDSMWRSVKRTVFVAAVWALWWSASLVLLIGFVVSLLVQGFSLTNVVAFPALWFLCTLVARRTVRRAQRATG